MLRSLNSLLYRAYLKKSGLIIGNIEDYYTITENINSFLYTIHILKAMNAGRE